MLKVSDTIWYKR